MFERIQKGWEITKQSFSVIKHDKEILIYPILSAAITIGLCLIFFFWFILSFFFSVISQSLANITFYLALIIFTIAIYFISIYFQAAIITSATIRFSGKNPTLSDGLKTPMKKITKLFFWAIISAIVGTILNGIRNAGRGKSRTTEIATETTSAIAGFAWNLITFYTVPIILFEKESTISSIKRSWLLFKKTWGENVTAQFTTGIIFFLFSLPFILLLFLSLLTGSTSFIIISIILFLIAIAILIVLATSVNGILKAALYQYAITHKLPKIYNPETVRNMFVRKR